MGINITRSQESPKPVQAPFYLCSWEAFWHRKVIIKLCLEVAGVRHDSEFTPRQTNYFLGGRVAIHLAVHFENQFWSSEERESTDRKNQSQSVDVSRHHKADDLGLTF